MNYENYVNRILPLLENYLRVRMVSKISLAWIAGGASILGFQDLAPYLTLIIRPELASNIDPSNTLPTFLGITLILIGSFIPIISQIFLYYRGKYAADLEKANEIINHYPQESFQFTMQFISSNLSINDNQLSKIENLCSLLLNSSFYFHTPKLTELAKNLGGELETFNTKLSLIMHPTGQGTYSIPPQQRNQNIQIEISNDCKLITSTFSSLHNAISLHRDKKIMRFFA